jgi:hypothetical protein
MESTVVTALAAAIGSIVGASASIATSLISQRTQTHRANVEWQSRERESLYNEFITEASRLTVDARVHSLEGAEQLASLYGVLNRIRLISGDDVVRKAEECCHHIVELYWRPNMTLDEFRAAYEAGQVDSLKGFSMACRLELTTMSPSP